MKINSIYMMVFILISTITTNAQNISPISAGQQAVYFNFGLDPAVTTTFGYTRGFEVDMIKKDIMLSAELAIPIAELDFNDYRFRIGAQTSVFNYKGWDFSVPFHLILRGTENWMHSATSFGADIAALFGYYGEGWFVNLEFGYDLAFLTKITATDRYKKYYYHDFKDGWYSNSSHFFNRGLRAGFRIRRTEITIRAGQSIIDWTAEESEFMPPFYGALGVNYTF